MVEKKCLYIGEVPISPEPGGAILLFRCFNYLNVDLDKVYVNLNKEDYKDALTYTYPLSKLRKTRFSALYALLNFKILWIFLFFRLLVKLRSYKTIYTVSHGVTFKPVYYSSKFLKKDLVVFHHDLYSKTFNLTNNASIAQEWFNRAIKSCFVKNLFVSPYMKKLYQAKGEVLYPTRGKSVLENSNPKSDFSDYRMYYAGSLHSDSNYKAIFNMAKYLETVNGRLFLYTNLTEERFAKFFHILPNNIVFNEFIPQKLLLQELYLNANCLLLIQNFDENDKIPQMINFQSKLADYTLVGVPIIVIAPQYASSVQWMSELGCEVGVHLEKYDKLTLQRGLNDLFSSKTLHLFYGRNAQIVGENYFSIEAFKDVLEGLPK